MMGRGDLRNAPRASGSPRGAAQRAARNDLNGLTKLQGSNWSILGIVPQRSSNRVAPSKEKGFSGEEVMRARGAETGGIDL
jgi:hypothetical protein